MSMTRVALAVAADHPAYAGHFPGTPVLPGVVLLDEALCAIGTACGLSLDRCRIASVKFASPVAPGEPLTVEYDASAGANGGRIAFTVLSGDRRVASGVLQAGPE
ncbi:hypothetical protein NCCP691_25620 [Noviherbaspirillum aridicola]|uniref:ApeI dehydratase-like domain-containing protein n=1 Tax=Noviherbaspirillum aridicola TaxID=2849687 RepID=A0ABQ4Q5T4_9BURK|nr:hypothetical protein [Noviherbaspirillum aridicola]GIZ52548.1 hypothetical protein NCCP691_25620 [Noviherbaspirillum aridicola]